MVACGEGGMITTNSEHLYKKLLSLRTHGISKENMSKNEGGWYYEMKELGYNYRLTDIQSALGITQLKKNIEGVRRRNKIATIYKNAFKDKVKFQDLPINTLNSHHLFIIEIDNRKEMYTNLRKDGILSQIHYIPIHTLPYYKNIGYDNANLTNSEKYYSKCLSLPMFPSLSDPDLEYVINKVLGYIK